MRSLDLKGQRFGKWFVLEWGHREWVCECDCGTIRSVATNNLRSGHSKSCGCASNHFRATACEKHGMHKSPEYYAWQSMKARCGNPNAQQYKNYGGRGIAVCARWQESFEAFFEDMGPRPSPKHSLDRKNNDGNYEPGNCRWVSMLVQNNNNRQARFLKFRGEKHSVSEWCRRLGLPRVMVSQRLRRGWGVERALGTPAGNYSR